MRLAGILRRPNADKAGPGFSRRGEFSTTGKAWEKYPQCGLPQGPSRGGGTAYPPSKNVANWFPGPLKIQILFAVLFRAARINRCCFVQEQSAGSAGFFRKFF